ncbi:cytochrome p450 domain-containing protein [Sarocladium implicatum]|nr:cytochrome p450 domain-containing protein [Sarocladium implicatum]
MTIATVTRQLRLLVSSNPFYAAVTAISVAFLSILIRWTLATLRPTHFPPGPSVTPGLGNLLQLPLSKPYLTFHEWSKTYGDIVGIKVGTGNLVILSKPEIVSDLFDRRGAHYSGRPSNHIMDKHIFPSPEDKAVAILQYDEYYRRWRKSFNYILSPGGIKRILPILEAEAANFSRLCLDGGKDYVRNVHYWGISSPFAVTCGKRIDDLPEDFIEKFIASQNALISLVVPGASPPVDVFPFLQYVPEWLGASWKKTAREVRNITIAEREMYLQYSQEQYTRLKEEPSSGILPSLMTKIMFDQDSNPDAVGFTEIELSHLGASLGGAAVDTTVVTLKSLMLLLACHPEVQSKAQVEIDRIGNGRPPRAEQLDQLVYLRACIFETLRFRPTTPSALPHVLDQDDHYKGFFFPKGTTFIANVWGLGHNEEDFESPDEWIPDRFLDNPYGLRPEKYAAQVKPSSKTSSSRETKEPMTVDTPASQPATLGFRRALYAFGTGRRICPGIDFAITSLLLAASKALWAYDVLPPLGGVDYSIETGYEDGVVTAPKNPKVRLQVRDDAREKGLMDDYERTRTAAGTLIPL